MPRYTPRRLSVIGPLLSLFFLVALVRCAQPEPVNSPTAAEPEPVPMPAPDPDPIQAPADGIDAEPDFATRSPDAAGQPVEDEAGGVSRRRVLRRERDHLVMPVYFGTDRNVTGWAIPEDFFGDRRGSMTYGRVAVSIPRRHKVGELESPSVWRFEFRRNPDKHIVLLDVETMEIGDFSSLIADDAYNARRREALVFIHGYNVTFENAARRTAQIAYDIQFDGPAAFFSWPSQGTLAGYTEDENNIKWATPHIQEFLTTIASLTDVDQVNVIAHSMGNRGATEALMAIKAAEDEPIKAKFKEIVLTAPDIDADIFKRDIAPRLIGDGARITLYASSKDVALQASKKVHGYARAGDSETLVIVPGIHTIDASDVKTDFLGHSYFGESESVISDLRDLINNRYDPDRRFWLRRIAVDQHLYWRFRHEPGR